MAPMLICQSRTSYQDDSKHQTELNGSTVPIVSSCFANPKQKQSANVNITNILQEQSSNMIHLKQHAQSNIASLWTSTSTQATNKLQPAYSFQPANPQLQKRVIPQGQSYQHPIMHQNIQAQQNQWQRQHQQVSSLLASTSQEQQHIRVKKIEKIEDRPKKIISQRVDEYNNPENSNNSSHSNSTKRIKNLHHQRHQSEVITTAKAQNFQSIRTSNSRQGNKENEMSVSSWMDINSSNNNHKTTGMDAGIKGQMTICDDKIFREMQTQQQQQSQFQTLSFNQSQTSKEKLSTFARPSGSLGVASSQPGDFSQDKVKKVISKIPIEGQLHLRVDCSAQAQQLQQQSINKSHLQQQQQQQQYQNGYPQQYDNSQQQQKIKVSQQQSQHSSSQKPQQIVTSSQFGNVPNPQIKKNISSSSQHTSYPVLEQQPTLSASSILTARSQTKELSEQSQNSTHSLQTQSEILQQTKQPLFVQVQSTQSQHISLNPSKQHSSVSPSSVVVIPQTSSVNLQIDHFSATQPIQLPGSTNLLDHDRIGNLNQGNPKSIFFDRRKKSHSITSNILLPSSRKVENITSSSNQAAGISNIQTISFGLRPTQQNSQLVKEKHISIQPQKEIFQDHIRVKSRSPGNASNQVWLKMSALMNGIGNTGQRSQVGSNLLTRNLNSSQTINNPNNTSANISSGSGSSKNIKNTNNSTLGSSQKILSETGSKKSILDECSLKKSLTLTFAQQLQTQKAKLLNRNIKDPKSEESMRKTKEQDNYISNDSAASKSKELADNTSNQKINGTSEQLSNQENSNRSTCDQQNNSNYLNLLASSKQPLEINKYSTLQYQPQQYSTSFTANYEIPQLNRQQLSLVVNQNDSRISTKQSCQIGSLPVSGQISSKNTQITQKKSGYLDRNSENTLLQIDLTKAITNQSKAPSGSKVESLEAQNQKVYQRNQPPVCNTDPVNEPAQACEMANNFDKISFITKNNSDFVITAKNPLSLVAFKGVADNEEFCDIRMPQQRSRRNGILGEKSPLELSMKDPIKLASSKQNIDIVGQDQVLNHLGYYKNSQDSLVSEMKKGESQNQKENQGKSLLNVVQSKPTANPFFIVETFNDEDNQLIDHQFESTAALLARLEKEHKTEIDQCNLECDEVDITEQLEAKIEADLPTFISYSNGLDHDNAFCHENHTKIGRFNLETMNQDKNDIRSYSSMKQNTQQFKNEQETACFTSPIVLLSASAQKKAKIEKELKDFARIEEEEGCQRIFGSENLEYLVSREADYLVDADYLSKSKQPNITSNMRQILLDWMMEVAEEFGLKRETYHIAVSTVDRYLSVKLHIKKREFQLIGVTALYMASKLEEIYPPRISDFVCSTSSGYAAEEINERELSIIESLNYLLNPPTISMWSNWFMCQWDIFASQSNEPMLLETENLIQFKQPSESSYILFREYAQLVDLSVLDFNSFRYNQRQLLASFMYLVIAKALGLIYTQMIQEEVTQGILKFERMEEFNNLIQPFLTLSFGLSLDQIYLDIYYAATFFSVPLCSELPSAAKQDSGKVFQGYYEDFLAFQTHNKDQLSILQGKN